ncbi:MAG: alpha-amylase family glycosyl hydrolase, partial [Planctomycetota bacterium]
MPAQKRPFSPPVNRFTRAFAAPALNTSLALAAATTLPHAPAQAQNPDFNDLRIYQVMVESFVDGDPAHDYNYGYGTSHHKGDLRGIINSLDYIASLNVNAIWMTPIFDSDAYQPQLRINGATPTDFRLDATGYYARDYFNVDPKFGTMDDARELVAEANARGIRVLFDGVFGHHKGALAPSPTGKLPVDSTNPNDYFNNPNGYPGRVADYNHPNTVEFYKEVATYWIEEVGIDGWRLDQGYQVPLNAWEQINTAVQQASQARADAGHEYGTLGYMVSEIWDNEYNIRNAAYGNGPDPVLPSAFDFPTRYAAVQVFAGDEGGYSGRPAYGLAEGLNTQNVYPDAAQPNLMLGNHDLLRFGDLLQRNNIADVDDPEYYARHRLAFLFQAAYTGPITTYYGEEIGDETPNFANQVSWNCVGQGLCDDHVARTSGKVPGVSVDLQDFRLEQVELAIFFSNLMGVRDDNPALSHGSNTVLLADNDLYVAIKEHLGEQILVMLNVGDSDRQFSLGSGLFDGYTGLFDLLAGDAAVTANAFELDFTVPALSGAYVELVTTTLAGDANDDGVVDLLDFDILAQNFGQGPGFLSGPSGGDFNGDGVVDLLDFDTLAQNFGSSNPATVPEPATAALITLAGAG